MRRASLRVWLFVVVLVLTPLAATGEEEPPTELECDDAPQALTPQPPEQGGNSPGAELEPPPAGPERQALDRIAHRYEARIRELEELARQVKGMELIDLQRRIEELKRSQSEEELSARVELAREAGDERRVEQLERTLIPGTPPVSVPEFRPVPVAPDENGGER